MKSIRVFFNILDVFMKALIVLITVVMISAAFLQVFSRDILQDAWKWTDELSRFCLVWLTFTSVALGVRYSTHIKIDTIYNCFPKKLQSAINILAYVCVFIISFVLVKFGLQLFASTSNQLSPALHWSMSMVYGILPFCGGVMILFAIEQILCIFGQDQTVSREKGGQK